MLLKRGADVNKANDDGVTPLFKAIQRVTATLFVRCLLRGHADMKKADKDGVTPLFMATRWGRADVAIILQAAAAAAADDYWWKDHKTGGKN